MFSWLDWRFLYLDPKGRITKQAFWVGVVPLAIIYVVLAAVVTFVFRGPVGQQSHSTGIGAIVIILLAAWPFWCLVAKRRHDRGGSGVEFAIYLLLLLLLQVWRLTLVDFSATAPRRFGAPRPGVVELLAAIPTSPVSYLIVSQSVSFVGLAALCILCSAQGKTGPNRYGPDPRAVTPPPT